MKRVLRATRTDQFIALVAVSLVIIGFFMVMRPFLSALLWAIVLTFSTWPAYRYVLALVRGQRTVAAALMTLIITVILVLPAVVIGMTLGNNVREFASVTGQWIGTQPPGPPAWLENLPLLNSAVADYWRSVSQDGSLLLRELERFVEPATGWVVRASVALGRGVLDLVLSVFLAFFLYRDGAVLGEGARSAAERLGGERGVYLLQTVAGGTVRGVVYGILGTALVQGLVAGIGFTIAGVPAAALLGLLTFFVSVIPVGPPLIWGPAAIWLYQNVSPGWAIFMVAWGFLVSSLDNLVRPLIIVQGNRMPFVLIFLGVIGGALAFGVVGVFLGPSLVSVCFRLLQEWLSSRRRGPASPSRHGSAAEDPAADADDLPGAEENPAPAD